MDPSTSQAQAPVHGVYLYWIPLGAGGSGFVQLNGRIYEAITARRERRPSLDLHHMALVFSLPGGRYVVETMWPSPDMDGARRGVVVEGPVFSRRLSFTRVFRYEVRCWRDGELPDAGEAVGGARFVSGDPYTGRLLLSLTPSVPAFGASPFSCSAEGLSSWRLIDPTRMIPSNLFAAKRNPRRPQPGCFGT